MVKKVEMREFDIFVVDDNENWLFLYKTILKEKGYKIKCFESPLNALKELQSTPPKLLLLDFMMPEINGDELMVKISELKVINSFFPILISELEITAEKEFELKSLGFGEVLSKQIPKEELLELISQGIKDWDSDFKNLT